MVATRSASRCWPGCNRQRSRRITVLPLEILEDREGLQVLAIQAARMTDSSIIEIARLTGLYVGLMSARV